MRPGWTIEPRPKWPTAGHLSPTQMAVGHLRRRSFESNATYLGKPSVDHRQEKWLSFELFDNDGSCQYCVDEQYQIGTQVPVSVSTAVYQHKLDVKLNSFATVICANLESSPLGPEFLLHFGT